MTCNHKKPGVAFWATVVVVVALVAYPLSFGPACWIVGNNETAISGILNVYYPILWAAHGKRNPGHLSPADSIIGSSGTQPSEGMTGLIPNSRCGSYRNDGRGDPSVLLRFRITSPS